MAKYIYPAIFTKEANEMYSVRFPDLECCYTQGADLQDAYEMAEDVLCLMLYHLEEKHEDIPAPSDLLNVKTEPGEFVSLVACDTLEYRRFYDNKAVKKTLTIPSWLNDQAIANGINFSAVLQAGLKNELHITDR